MTTPRPLQAVPDDPLDDLFVGDRTGFVAARDRLASDLKRAGHPDEAAAVKALRKPSVAAWALNRVAHDDPDTIGGFLDAAEWLRSAQEQGAEPADLRAAIEAHRSALRRALDAVASVAESPNLDPVTTEASRTLDAAALDADVADRLRAGRLTGTVTTRSALDALRLADTGTRTRAAVRTPPPTPPRVPARPVRPAQPRGEPSAQEAERRVRAVARLDALRHAADAARAESEQAHAAVADAQRSLDRAHRDARRADAALTKALDALERAIASAGD